MSEIHFGCPCGGTGSGVDPASATCAVCQAPLDVSGSPIDLTDDALAALIAGSPVPVLVDFWGPHCPPCRLVAPVVDAVARARAGRLVVVKVDMTEHDQIATGLGIRGIPHFAIYVGGDLADQRGGALSSPQLEQWIDAAIA